MSFTDVPETAWYAPYVQLALEKKMIRDANNFRPNDSVTRAEAMKILTQALLVLVKDSTTSTFTDVPENHSLAKYIEAAYFLEIIDGQVRANGTRFFRPNDPINRAEIAKVIVKSFGL